MTRRWRRATAGATSAPRPPTSLGRASRPPETHGRPWLGAAAVGARPRGDNGSLVGGARERAGARQDRCPASAGRLVAGGRRAGAGRRPRARRRAGPVADLARAAQEERRVRRAEAQVARRRGSGATQGPFRPAPAPRGGSRAGGSRDGHRGQVSLKVFGGGSGFSEVFVGVRKVFRGFRRSLEVPRGSQRSPEIFDLRQFSPTS